MEKLCTNKNHSYKHNEQINNQNIDNAKCFGVKFAKNLYRNDFTIIFRKNMVLVEYIGIFFYIYQYFWPHTVLYIQIGVRWCYCMNKDRSPKPN
jgi:hypothetical protein